MSLSISLACFALWLTCHDPYVEDTTGSSGWCLRLVAGADSYIPATRDSILRMVLVKYLSDSLVSKKYKLHNAACLAKYHDEGKY